MKNKSYSFTILLLLLILQSNIVLCQEKQADSLSRVFSQITLGFTELTSVVVGYNFDNHNALSFKFSGGVIISTDAFLCPNNANAIGIRYSYHFNQNKCFLSNINITPSIIYYVGIDQASFPTNSYVKGYIIELTTGNKIKYEQGFSFFYEVGLFVTQLKGRELRLWPTLKIGTNYNF
ncbi:hypothetical protein MNBD_IGNAVI01-1581 [hydrothermal vent metagenome]|uniref:Outer membrane protein beta-barrel domain-containing protein n=1 Tax=hydrothermal vent metagenome TaxID=652676 RepID=A0A3B1C8Y3_9ZZZZ